ncbi:hypothetical protein B0H14DRAFT_2603282 [Mycena olivaceomarginata]|nr:hypothetical protein B0H14DRAFT_2603282 [Mycena olivaceomarginata]
MNMIPSTVLLTPIFLHLSACFSVDEFSDCSKVSLNTFPGLPLEEEHRSRGDFVRKQRRDQHSGDFGINKVPDILRTTDIRANQDRWMAVNFAIMRDLFAETDHQGWFRAAGVDDGKLVTTVGDHNSERFELARTPVTIIPLSTLKTLFMHALSHANVQEEDSVVIILFGLVSKPPDMEVPIGMLVASTPLRCCKLSALQLNTTQRAQCSRAYGDHVLAAPNELHTYPRDYTELDGQMLSRLGIHLGSTSWRLGSTNSRHLVGNIVLPITSLCISRSAWVR